MRATKDTPLRVVHLPMVLSFFFQRSSHDGSAGKKITDVFYYPLSICMRDFGLPSEQSYDLHAVHVHVGDQVSSGHYIAFVKTSTGWLRCNDTMITEEKEHVVLHAEASALFYNKRVGSFPNPPSLECLSHNFQN
jgi:ubiquitin carboxyl-terminal hydrolase 36/42